MGYVEYSSNNSGGSWWLKDDDWYALEKAGWKVLWHWFKPDYTQEGNDRLDVDGMPKIIRKPETAKNSWDAAKEGDRWLGALAKRAYRHGLSMRDAADEWERITGQCATDAGCPCRGNPHDFTEYDNEGKFVTSGPSADYDVSW